MSESPFDSIRDLVAAMPGPDEAAAARVRARDRMLAKPAGSLGRLEGLAEWLAAWQGKAPPSVERPLVCLFAGSHGVAARGVSAASPDTARALLETFAAGGGAINQVCATHGFGFKVFDLALDLPTADIAEAPAMDERACVATMAFGMEAVAGGIDLLGLGDLGIGGTTAAAALYAALYGGPTETWVGPSAGLDEAIRGRRIAAVETALDRHGSSRGDPLTILASFGGREIAAIAGAILAARQQRVPVVLDGPVPTAAAAILHALDPRIIAHCLAGHLAADGAHREVLERLGLVPILSLGLRLGEGTGAALAMGIVKAAAAIHRDMATLEAAGLSGRTLD